jgi:nickel/cobalt exporter
MRVNLIYYLTASLLGGLHALEPGHGKTVVAAYLIGSKGKKIDAVLLGLVVTLTHTFSVILLAVAAKLASTRITLTEESLHGYLGVVAGFLILVVGLWMLVGRMRGKEPFHSHSHGHGHTHSSGHNHFHANPHSHDHSHDEAHLHGNDHSHGNNHIDNHEHAHDSQIDAAHGGKRVGYWQLFLLGVSGGLVPCPAAIAILLAAVGAGRLGEGLSYILLFSLGLATVLIAIGMIVVNAGRLASRFLDAKKFARKIAIASSAIITLIGIVTIANSVKHVI